VDLDSVKVMIWMINTSNKTLEDMLRIYKYRLKSKTQYRRSPDEDRGCINSSTISVQGSPVEGTTERAQYSWASCNSSTGPVHGAKEYQTAM